MSSSARQRPLRTHHPLSSNGGANEHDSRAAKRLSSSGMGHHRTSQSRLSRRKRLPTVVVTTASVVLLLVVVFVRRSMLVLVVSPPRHHNDRRTPAAPLPNDLAVHVALPNEEDAVSRRILTAFLEPPNTLDTDGTVLPLPPRNTSASLLTRVKYPRVSKCSQLMQTWPIDDSPSDDDPFLPWIHDVFPNKEGTAIHFVAQNKRRCHVGQDKQEEMKYWEPQIALFQPVHVYEEQQQQQQQQRHQTQDDGRGRRYRLSSQTDATWNETRFQCVFHTLQGDEYTTFSNYPFNYEYVSWRKSMPAMYQTTGKDNMQFWLSQLLFSCPVPTELQALIASGSHVVKDKSNLWLDLVPIRTPTRNGRPLFTQNHVGRDLLQTMSVFDAKTQWGNQHWLPPVKDSGRWANIPICLPPWPQQHQRLVACTWTAASYTRRGDAVTMADTALRLREWILFHKMVGFETIHVYDNTVGSKSPLENICNEFDFVHHHKWPATVCNNNRPNNPSPGERSSQYAAEASCRERYGHTSDWMAFIDTDEYLVPMKSNTWNELLDEMDTNGIKILKMKSSRSKPRLDLMEVQDDQTTCVDPLNRKSRFEAEPCVVPRKNETFLRTYNCEFIKPPRPDRFQRAMKQIYRPSHVWSHFVHYSTVTADVARLHKDYGPEARYHASVHSASWQRSSPEVFLDELTEGTLVHGKSVLPHETMYRSSVCRLNSTLSCSLGFLCPAHMKFSDAFHKKNLFQNDIGEYCNCWTNPRVEELFAPKLKLALEKHERRVGG